MGNKKDKIKQQKKQVAIVLSVSAILCIALSFFIKNEQSQNLVRTFGFGFILATILIRVFNDEIGTKPTREEIEEKLFGGQKKNLEK